MLFMIDSQNCVPIRMAYKGTLVKVWFIDQRMIPKSKYTGIYKVNWLEHYYLCYETALLLIIILPNRMQHRAFIGYNGHVFYNLSRMLPTKIFNIH